ncbi:hypothetical protein [Sulfurimonas sp.]|uniref:hypothetical protein n=1 Tax=Sulfurimonas sp. TaxID=2022749 RepID=UPI0025E094B6|nr:hypothetical protein [Sulfurimonas sp.]
MNKTSIILLIFFLLLSFIFLLYPQKEITYSFYHWKNKYNIKNNTDKLYIKVLDIEYTNKLELIKTKFTTNPNTDFVPVVYITNKAMKKATFIELVNKVSKHLNLLPYSFNEIQFDCDWSLSTRAKYFDFLNEMKKS